MISGMITLSNGHSVTLTVVDPVWFVNLILAGQESESICADTIAHYHRRLYSASITRDKRRVQLEEELASLETLCGLLSDGHRIVSIRLPERWFEAIFAFISEAKGTLHSNEINVEGDFVVVQKN